MIKYLKKLFIGEDVCVGGFVPLVGKPTHKYIRTAPLYPWILPSISFNWEKNRFSISIWKGLRGTRTLKWFCLILWNDKMGWVDDSGNIREPKKLQCLWSKVSAKR